MIFIEVTQMDGHRAYIRAELIETVAGNDKGCMIGMADLPEGIQVQETEEQMVNLLAACGKVYVPITAPDCPLGTDATDIPF